MGGVGSGRGMRFNTKRSKAFVEEFEPIDARSFSYGLMQKLPEQGIAINFHDFSIHILKDRLQILSGERFFNIKFSLSKGNYGNYRYWLTCPNPSCFGRCRKLYLCRSSSGVTFFLCRKCLNLAYKSQNKTMLDRLIDEKWDLVRKLGCESDFILASQKPKWMHWKTFEKFRSEIVNLNNEAINKIYSLFGKYSFS